LNTNQKMLQRKSWIMMRNWRTTHQIDRMKFQMIMTMRRMKFQMIMTIWKRNSMIGQRI